MREGYLQWLWLAVSRPREFFAGFPAQVRLALALRPALVSILLGAAMLSWALARTVATGSAFAVILLVLPGALLYGTILWLVGGLVLSRSAQLGERGWEVAAWAWVPAGFMALALLPVVAVFPVTSLVVGLLGLPPWHLTVVDAGLTVFARQQRRRALLLYGGVVLGLPVTLLLLAAALALWGSPTG